MTLTIESRDGGSLSVSPPPASLTPSPPSQVITHSLLRKHTHTAFYSYDDSFRGKEDQFHVSELLGASTPSFTLT